MCGILFCVPILGLTEDTWHCWSSPEGSTGLWSWPKTSGYPHIAELTANNCMSYLFHFDLFRFKVFHSWCPVSGVWIHTHPLQQVGRCRPGAGQVLNEELGPVAVPLLDGCKEKQRWQGDNESVARWSSCAAVNFKTANKKQHASAGMHLETNRSFSSAEVRNLLFILH